MGTRGYTAQAEWAGEAAALSALGHLTRNRDAGKPHDKLVPIKAFQRDLVRKVALRKVMGKKKPDDSKQQEVLAKDPDSLIPGTQFTKEVVNYRYSGKPDQSCGACIHFKAPSACEIVAGLINRMDVCNKFEPLHEGRGAEGVVKSELIPNENTLGEVQRPRPGRMLVQAYMAEQDDEFDGEDGCADDEKDAEGRCPDDPLFDDSTAGQYDPDSMLAEAEPRIPRGSGGGQWTKGKGGGGIKHQNTGAKSSVSQHRSTGTSIKSHGGKQGSNATSKPGKGGGIRDHKTGKATSVRGHSGSATGGRVQSITGKTTLRASEVSPPGWSGTTKAMKKHKDISNPFALAWWAAKKGEHPHYPPEKKSAEDELPVGKLVVHQGREGVMSVMGQSHPISNMPASSSGKYKHPANRKVAGARRWGH